MTDKELNELAKQIAKGYVLPKPLLNFADINSGKVIKVSNDKIKNKY